MSTFIVPGIFERDFSEVTRKLALIEDVAPLVQIDIADGKLVDGKTFEPYTQLTTLSPHTDIELHLMVTDPSNFVQLTFPKLCTIYAQVEAGEHEINSFLKTGPEHKYKVGLSLNPETPVSVLHVHAGRFQAVQLMTVTPGAQGRPLQEKALAKIAQVKQLFPTIPVQIDGGANKATISKLVVAGADSAEAGAAIFAQPNPVTAYLELENLWKKEKQLRKNI